MLHHSNLQRLAQRLQRPRNPVDFSGVAQIGEAIYFLRRGVEPPGQFSGAHPLPDHLIEQQDLGGNAGGQFDKLLARLDG